MSRPLSGMSGASARSGLARELGWLRPAGGLTSQVQTAGGSLAGNEHSLIASILSARSGPACSLCWAEAAERAEEGDPEWFTPSPPPPNNFDVIPRVRSVEPMKDIRREVAAISSAAETVGQPAAPRSP